MFYKEIDMNIEKLNKAIDEVLIALESLKAAVNEEQLNEMAPFITSKPFPQFRHEALFRLDYKKKRQAILNTNPEKAYELYPKLKYENNCFAFETEDILITNSCIEHVVKDHIDMDDDIWLDFIQTCNPSTDYKVKAKYDGEHGKRWIYKCKNDKHCFGYVLDIFDKAKPQAVTVFYNDEPTVDNWIRNEINRNNL